MKRRQLLASATALSIGPALAPSLVRAQAFPDKPIRFVVPYAPGGATDTSARIAAEYLTNKFGQQVLVENKPGGGTIIATEIVAKARPDGYTILMAAAPVATNTSFGLKLPYDPVKELAPVCSYVDMPLLLACNPARPTRRWPSSSPGRRSRPRRSRLRRQATPACRICGASSSEWRSASSSIISATRAAPTR